MATAEELQTQLTALKKARASGALVVRHGDTSVTYRSIAEITLAINEITKELNGLEGSTRRRPRYVLQPGKGF